MHLSVPKQVYGDLVSNGIINSLVHGIVPCSASLRISASGWRDFFARITTFALIIHENVGNVKFFLREIAKNVKTGLILATFAFFANVFSEKSQKNANYREKLTKTSKTEFILANFAFFVKVISRKKNAVATVARGPVPRDLPTETKTVSTLKAPDGFCSDRGMARDRPSHYGARRDFLRPTVMLTG